MLFIRVPTCFLLGCPPPTRRPTSRKSCRSRGLRAYSSALPSMMRAYGVSCAFSLSSSIVCFTLCSWLSSRSADIRVASSILEQHRRDTHATAGTLSAQSNAHKHACQHQAAAC